MVCAKVLWKLQSVYTGSDARRWWPLEDSAERMSFVFRPAPRWEPAAQRTGSKQAAHLPALSSRLAPPARTPSLINVPSFLHWPFISDWNFIGLERNSRRYEIMLCQALGECEFTKPPQQPGCRVQSLSPSYRWGNSGSESWMNLTDVCLSLVQKTYLQTPRSANAAPSHSKLYPSPLTPSELSIRQRGGAASQGSLFHC